MLLITVRNVRCGMWLFTHHEYGYFASSVWFSAVTREDRSVAQLCFHLWFVGAAVLLIQFSLGILKLVASIEITWAV